MDLSGNLRQAVYAVVKGENSAQPQQKNDEDGRSATIKMNILCISRIIFLIVLTGTAGFGQRIGKSPPVRMNSALPSIYLTPEKCSEPCNKDAIQLRIHNNTRWPVWIETSGSGGKAFGDATLYYEVVTKEDEIRYRKQCHVCSVTSLKSGSSTLFSLPAENASGGYSIRLRFSFGWETSFFSPEEPRHYVYFRLADLRTP